MTVDHTLLGHVFLFLTTIAGFVFQWMREGRRYRWQREQFRSLGQQIENGQSKAGGG